MEKVVSKVIGLYDICTSLLGNSEENHEESNFINIKAQRKLKKSRNMRTNCEDLNIFRNTIMT